MAQSKDLYAIQNDGGDLIAEFPYTVDGLALAADAMQDRGVEFAAKRWGNPGRIINPNRVDLDWSDGLSPTECQILEEMWGL